MIIEQTVTLTFEDLKRIMIKFLDTENGLLHYHHYIITQKDNFVPYGNDNDTFGSFKILYTS